MEKIDKMGSLEPGEQVLTRLATAIDSVVERDRIKDWDDHVLELITILGEIFRDGLRGGFTQVLFSGSPTFWPFVREFSAPGTVQTIRALPEALPLFSNNTEREHAWIIASLNSGDFSGYLPMVKRDKKLLRVFYSEKQGALLLNDEFLDRFEDQMMRLEENVACDLSFEGYVQFLNKRSGRKGEVQEDEAIILPDLGLLQEGRLFSPVPMISAKVDFLESTLPTQPSDKDSARTETGSLSVIPPALQGNSSQDVIKDEPFTMEITEDNTNTEDQTRQYVSKFRKFIDETQSTASEHTEESSERPGSSGIADDEIAEDHYQIFVSSPTISPPNSEEAVPLRADSKILDVKDESSTLPQILVTLPEEVLAQAMEEINTIMENPRPAHVALVEGHADDSSVPLPLIVETPPYDPLQLPCAPESPYSTPSISSHSSELGFFGIPLNVKSLEGLLYPVSNIAARVARSVDLFTLLSSDSEEDRDVSRTSLDAHLFLDPVMLMSRGVARGNDGFEIDVRVCPATSLEAQNYQCIACQTLLHEKDSSNINLCDISGKYFCDDCFGDAKLISPARILRDWDFGERLVSRSVAQDYSKHLRKTLIDLSLVAPHLFDDQAEVQTIDRLRNALLLAMETVDGCPSGIAAQMTLKFRFFPHLLQSPTLYTIQDLLDVRAGLLSRLLAAALRKLDHHIRHDCQRCRLLGRFCALCRDTEPIFYYDLEEVVECPRCLMLTHRQCASKENDCVNCRRVHMSIMSPSVDPASISEEID